MLVDGSCVEKFNPRVEAYGTLDELNSSLGVVRSSLVICPLPNLDATLFSIQNHLFIAGSLLATQDDQVLAKLTPIKESHIEFLEKQIDKMTETLVPLRNFIIPAGHPVASYLHLSRTICRRAERRCAEISLADQRYGLVLIYLNRLSDFLFTAARWVHQQTGNPDVLWDAKT